MKNIIKLAMSAMLALGCAYIAKSQACPGYNNSISYKETSSALGADNKVYGKSSTAIGLNNTVSVQNSPDIQAFAIGNNNKATSYMTFALGMNNNVTTEFSFGIGKDNIVAANSSIALGYLIKNTKKFGITIGCGVKVSQPLLNDTEGIMFGINSTKPTLFISKAEGAYYSQTGKVGIGNVTSPQAKLHIKADLQYGGEDADILLEPTLEDKKAVIYFRNENQSIAVPNSGNMNFTANNYVFAKGSIHVGKIVVGNNSTTHNPEISFNGTSNKISVGPDNAMSFAAGGFNFNTKNAMTINVGSAAITSGEAVSLTAPSCSLNISKVGIGCVNNVDGFALAVKGGVVSTEMSVMNVDAWPDFVFSGDYKRMSLYELEEYIDRNHHLPEIPSAEEVSENGIDLGEMNALLLQKVEELTLHVIELQKQIDIQQNEIDELKSR